MKRYLLFVGECYHPNGGIDDLAGDYDSPEDAVSDLRRNHGPGDMWAEIVDHSTMLRVAAYSNDSYKKREWTVRE